MKKKGLNFFFVFFYLIRFDCFQGGGEGLALAGGYGAEHSLKIQVPNSYGLGVKVFRIFFRKRLVSQFINILMKTVFKEQPPIHGVC